MDLKLVQNIPKRHFYTESKNDPKNIWAQVWLPFPNEHVSRPCANVKSSGVTGGYGNLKWT